MTFEALGFEAAYECELDPEFPGSGDWRLSVFEFRREGQRDEPFRSAWGTPQVMRVMPRSEAAWVGFAESSGHFLSGVFGLPDPQRLLWVAGGVVYIIPVLAPARYERLDLGVTAVRPTDDRTLLLLADEIRLIGIGRNGLAWETERIALDGFEIVSASPDGIVCEADYFGQKERRVIDPKDGSLIEGRRFPW